MSANATKTTAKTAAGNFFEDFRVGQLLEHATPRTVTEGDVALYLALFGSRHALHSSIEFARSIGYRTAPIDDILAFHILFGKTVPDISLNAVAISAMPIAVSASRSIPATRSLPARPSSGGAKTRTASRAPSMCRPRG